MCTNELVEIALGKLLKDKHLTVATAESCTGGSIAARLTSIPGSSEYVKGGVVVYCNEMKEKILGVPPEILDKYSAVSEEVVKRMAQGVMNLMKVDCALATSGIAGPGGAMESKPIGTIWIAVAYKDEISTLKQTEDYGRTINVERTVNNALSLLYELIQTRIL